MPTRVRDLSGEECLERLTRRGFLGRLAFVSGGRPEVLPVNYVADERSITFCTEEGTKLSSLGGGAHVAFEVDESRPMRHAGWSVVARGTAREVTDPGELDRLRRGPLRSWAVRRPAHWLRIEIEEISGRSVEEEPAPE